MSSSADVFYLMYEYIFVKGTLVLSYSLIYSVIHLVVFFMTTSLQYFSNDAHTNLESNVKYHRNNGGEHVAGGGGGTPAQVNAFSGSCAFLSPGEGEHIIVYDIAVLSRRTYVLVM